MADPLIRAGTLAKRLRAAPGAARPIVLDVRWALSGPAGHTLYIQGHIPGAAFVDLDAELAAPAGRGARHPLPGTGAFQLAMRRAGVCARRPVVAYDSGAPGPAARAWWLLRYFGHDDVSVLDGGIAAWIAAGGTLESGHPAPPPRGDFAPAPGGMQLLDANGAAAVASRGVLLDARAPERFRGESEPIDPVAGHIPGARNLAAGELVDPRGGLHEPALLRSIFDRVGVGADTEVGAYCGSGVTAAQLVLALERAGVHGSLYVGSWSDWISDAERPVSTEAHPA